MSASPRCKHAQLLGREVVSASVSVEQAYYSLQPRCRGVVRCCIMKRTPRSEGKGRGAGVAG
eukprot:scaffold30241_cov58-Phaeocystis_antarctica.AAC.2